jgi:hypothetical protein
MTTIILEALKNGILITGLVMVMMMLIEYINIHSHGKSFRNLKSSPLKQVLVGASLGAIPGCFGGFAVVSLYTHKLLSFGALVAMMIASSGDEAFIMLAMIPETALILIPSLFVVAITAGIVVNRFVKKEEAPFSEEHYIKHEDCCGTHKKDPNPVFGSSIIHNLTHISRQRALILTGIVLFMGAILAGLLQHSHDNSEAEQSHTIESHLHSDEQQAHTQDEYPHIQDEYSRVCIQEEHDHTQHEKSESSTEANIAGTEIHDHEHQHEHLNILDERWINIFFAILSLAALILTAVANEHFIQEHIWGHVVKKHLKSIFLWTFGALLIIHYGIQFLDIEEWIAGNIYIMILLAAVIGLIPESGPHMAFVTLFATGMIPFSVLMASSIVQDGHTALPLLAESKRSFIKAKIINMIIGMVIGGALHFAGL